MDEALVYGLQGSGRSWPTEEVKQHSSSESCGTSFSSATGSSLGNLVLQGGQEMQREG